MLAYVCKNISDTLKLCDNINHNSDFNKYRTEIFTSLNNTVHSIQDLDERLKELRFYSSDEEELMKAFCYLANQIKHDKDLNYIYSEINCSSYPRIYSYQYCQKPKLLWADFTDNGRTNSRGKRIYYDKYLNKKGVVETLLMGNAIIDKGASTFHIESKRGEVC